ncbi:MAG: ABC transporter ATP-binding protein [Firmicutes bacterium]|nr:ABC transporter ATP-binding protein [Bacillota bacterium]
MAKMRLQGVSFAYGTQPALKEVSLDLHPGVFYGIVGPNGAGKSTLLKVLNRFLIPQKGSVFLNERDLGTYSLKELAREIGVIPQRSQYFPSTVEEVVLLGRAPYSYRFQRPSGRDMEIAKRAMEAAGVLSFASHLVNELSGGERQRVTLARVLAQDTEVLLLDEPTAHLDLEHRIRTARLVQKKAREGVSCAAVLHDLNLVSNYCDYIYVLSRGELVAEGNPEEVFTPDLIQKVYNVSVPTLKHPQTGRPLIIL